MIEVTVYAVCWYLIGVVGIFIGEASSYWEAGRFRITLKDLLGWGCLGGVTLLFALIASLCVAGEKSYKKFCKLWDESGKGVLIEFHKEE